MNKNLIIFKILLLTSCSSKMSFQSKFSTPERYYQIQDKIQGSNIIHTSYKYDPERFYVVYCDTIEVSKEKYLKIK